MKRFRFSLSALLALRKERTQRCEFLLAAELGKLAMIKNQVENTRKVEDEALFSARAKLDELRLRELLLSKALKERRALRIRLTEAERKVEELRHTYLEAQSKSAALEKLKEKRRNYWKSAVRKEEFRNLDEIAKGSASRLDVRGGEE